MLRSFDASVYLQDRAKPSGIPEIALIALQPLDPLTAVGELLTLAAALICWRQTIVISG
jgi:hypothetical protein